MTNLYTTQQPAATATWGPESLGLRFSADVAGQVTAIRYWANAQSTGSVIPVGLYDSAGNLLGSGSRAQVAGDVGAWVSVPLSSPVPITAGATYVAAYNPVQYRMPYTSGGFATARDNGNLHALASAMRHKVNGNVATLAFPNDTAGTDDWFVDVAFTPGGSNQAPVANAGPAQSGIEPFATVALSGSGTDADGTIASYTWRQISGTAVSLSSTSSASPTFTAPATPAAQSLVFGLIVKDNAGASSPESTVAIDVLPATEFTAKSGAWVGIQTKHSW